MTAAELLAELEAKLAEVTEQADAANQIVAADYQETKSLRAALAAAEAREKALREALEDAIDLASEGWGYAGDYFNEKWDSVGRLARLRAALAAGKETERHDD